MIFQTKNTEGLKQETLSRDAAQPPLERVVLRRGFFAFANYLVESPQDVIPHGN